MNAKDQDPRENTNSDVAQTRNLPLTVTFYRPSYSAVKLRFHSGPHCKMAIPTTSTSL